MGNNEIEKRLTDLESNYEWIKDCMVDTRDGVYCVDPEKVNKLKKAVRIVDHIEAIEELIKITNSVGDFKKVLKIMNLVKGVKNEL